MTIRKRVSGLEKAVDLPRPSALPITSSRDDDLIMDARVCRSAVINDKGPLRDLSRRTARAAFPVEK